MGAEGAKERSPRGWAEEITRLLKVRDYLTKIGTLDFKLRDDYLKWKVRREEAEERKRFTSDCVRRVLLPFSAESESSRIFFSANLSADPMTL